MNRTIRHPEDWLRFLAWFNDHPSPFPFQVKEGEGRTLSQNALIHKWYGEIALQRQDMTAVDVKGELHHEFALPIRLRDEQFEYVWARTGAQLSYEQQKALLASGTLGVSSKMTTKELKDFSIFFAFSSSNIKFNGVTRHECRGVVL